MKIHLEQIITNDKCHEKSGFVDSRFVKTCDELVIGSADTNGFDKNIDKSIGNWSSLPKVTNPDVILLQKARGKMPVYF